MSRDDDIAASTRNVVAQKIPTLSEAVQKVRAEASHAGRLHSASLILSVKKTCEQAYREICISAAAHIAEIEGEQAARHMLTVSEILTSIQPKIIETFGFQSQGRSTDSLVELAGVHRAELETAMEAEVQHTVRDLGLGIAGGVNVKTRQQIAIDNRGGAGQFAINSSGASQTVGRDQIALSSLAGVTELLRELRGQIATLETQSEAHEALEDAVISIECEAHAAEPSPSRLKRLIIGAGKTARDLGVSVAAETIVAYSKAAGWMP